MVRRGVDGSSSSEGLKYLEIIYFCCLIWYRRAPPLQGGDRGSTAARHLREFLEFTNVSLAPPAALRSWGQVLRTNDGSLGPNGSSARALDA